MGKKGLWLLLLFFLGATPAWAQDLGEWSANPADLSGSSSFFGLFDSFGSMHKTNKTNQINQTDHPPTSRLSRSSRPLPHRPNKPNKRDEPVSAFPTAAACELKGDDPAAEPLRVIS
jgi:hypothetical protein